jgi:hypothetical protein
VICSAVAGLKRGRLHSQSALYLEAIGFRALLLATVPLLETPDSSQFDQNESESVPFQDNLALGA